MTTLLSAAQDALALDQLLQEAEGELTPDLETWLDEVEKSVSGKVDSYHFVLGKLEANEAHLRQEAAALEAAARSIAKVRDGMRGRIKLAMATMNTTELRGSAWRFKLTPSQPRLVIDDETKLPAKYRVPITVYEVKKDELKNGIAAGEAIGGAHIETGETLRSYPNKAGK